MRKILIAACLLSAVACASNRGPAAAPPPPPIRSIAVVAGDTLSNALAAELFNQGFRTFEVPASQDLTPAGLQALGSRGVDAILVVKSTKGMDSFPDNASIRVLRTQNGATAADFNWSNAAVRKNLAESARDVARTLQHTVPRP